MKPYYEHGGITIYHGDCRDVLEDMRGARVVDLLLTDPPYGMAFTQHGKSSAQANVAGDGVRAGMRILRHSMIAVSPLLSEDAHLLVFCHWNSWPDFSDVIGSHAKLRNALIWFKRSGGQGAILKDYLRNYEVILYAGRGNRQIGGDGSYSAVLEFARPPQIGRNHPTEKPVELLAHLVRRHCPLAGVVLDPFMGSGSTLIGAAKEGRAAIGIEIEERYCEIAAKRLQQEALPLEATA